MKMMNFSMMRCVTAIAIGILLMVWPEAAILYLVIAIGAMFFLPSLFSLVGYFMKGRQAGMYFPIVSLGSLLFGLWLMVSPGFFVGILMYVLGAVLVFAGISQIANLMSARSFAVVPFGYFVLPILVLLASDAAKNAKKKLTDKCSFYNVELQKVPLDTAQLALAVGKRGAVAAVGVTNEGLARAVKAKLDKELLS